MKSLNGPALFKKTRVLGGHHSGGGFCGSLRSYKGIPEWKELYVRLCWGPGA